MTTNYFETAAAQWDDNPNRVRLMRTVAEAVLREARPGPADAVLDYGCGTGLVGLYLLDHVASVTGADNAQAMLDVLDGKIAAAGLERMTTLRLDLETDPPPAQRFDLIAVGMALHHIAGLDRTLRAFRTLLRPGGKLAIADLDSEPGLFHGPEADAFVHHHGFDRDDLARRLEAAGFGSPRAVTVARFRKPVHTGGDHEFSIFLLTASAGPIS